MSMRYAKNLPNAHGLNLRPEKRKWSIPVLVALIVVCIGMIFPIYWLFGVALKPPEELNTFPISWWPENPRWQNFADATDPRITIPFWRLTLNSIILSTISGVLGTAACALVGFGFARLRGVGKNVIFVALIGMMMMPPIITLIPTYLMFARMGIVGTYWPWVLWGLTGSASGVFLMRQFFKTLPKELDEAAILDGCNWFDIFWRIALPLSKPALVTIFVYAFVGTWGDFITPLLLLNPDNTTLAVGLATGYRNTQGYPLKGLLAAGAVLYAIPAVLLFASVQKAYVQGLASTGLKG